MKLVDPPQTNRRRYRLLSPLLGLTSVGLVLTGCPTGGLLENAEEHQEARTQNCDPAPLFEDNCGSADCHGAGENGDPPEGGVDLLSAGLEGRLLDQPAAYPDLSGCPEPPESYINSSNWEASLLWTKLNDTQVCGDGMPIPHAVLGFDETQMSCVASWIQRVIAEGSPGGSGGSGAGTGGADPGTGGGAASGGSDGSGGAASAPALLIEGECAMAMSCPAGVTGSVGGTGDPMTEAGGSGTAVNYLSSGVELSYAGVMTAGHTAVEIAYSKGGPEAGELSIHLGSAAGTEVGSLTLTETGDWMTYQTATVTLSQTLTGPQTIVLVVGGDAGAAGLLNLDSIELVAGAAQ